MMQTSMKIYKSFEEFYASNADGFDKVLRAKTELKSPMECAQTGSAIVEAERLSYVFLNYKSLVTDLKLGLSASVLIAKDNMKAVRAELFKQSSEKAANAKERDVESHPKYIEAAKIYSQLNDIKEYLDLKHQDFDSCHYYYKNIAGAGSSGN